MKNKTSSVTQKIELWTLNLKLVFFQLVSFYIEDLNISSKIETAVKCHKISAFQAKVYHFITYIPEGINNIIY